MSVSCFSLAIRMGDNALILAQQNAKWCGHGPTLEEDIAMTNIALDLIGQARLWLGHAGKLENKGRTEDQLAFFRDASEFTNAYICEQPNGDYGQTLMRQYLFDLWHDARIKDLATSSDQAVNDIAHKGKNEVLYHRNRSRDLIMRLADGNEESHLRMQTSLNYLWPAFGSVFEDHLDDDAMENAKIASRPSVLRKAVIQQLKQELSGLLAIPDSTYAHQGAVRGIHSENLGHILSPMQVLQRNYPGLEW